MAELFGVAAGSISLITAFTGCVECFKYVQFGRHFERDFRTNQLLLSCARLRLSRWGESVKIYTDPKLGRSHATEDELQLARTTLIRILELFDESKNISRKYRKTARAGEGLSICATWDMDLVSRALNDKMEALAERRQTGRRFLKLTGWALYDRGEFQALIDKIISLMDQIETLFPAPEAQIRLVREEAAEVGDRESLSLLENIAAGVDGLLQTAAKEVRTGHQYLKVVIKGKAQAGDLFCADWVGGAVGRSNVYGDVTVEETGKALLGNQYGGAKGFLDD